MKTLEEISSAIVQIFKTEWNTREGQVVPEAADVKMGNDAVELDATILYADLKDSTGLVSGYKNWFAAEIYKAYLLGACEIIKNNDGVITSFDGDRVMAVFIGSSKNTAAAKAALQINYIVTQVINPKIIEIYPNSTYKVQQAVGIDTCKVFVARTGIRGDNDLVWVGNAANIAAKLCSIRSGYSSYLTTEVYDKMHDSSKLGGTNKEQMWTKLNWNEKGIPVYGSNWHWKP